MSASGAPSEEARLPKKKVAVTEMGFGVVESTRLNLNKSYNE